MRLDGTLSLAMRTAGCGGLAWGAFAVVESGLLVVLPAARESALVLTPSARIGAWAWLVTLYVLTGWAAGFLAGAAAALARGVRARPAVAAPELAQLTLVLAWALHLAGVRHLSRSAYLSLAVALVIGGVLTLRVLRPTGAAAAPRSAWLAGPWGAALALLTPVAMRDGLHVTWLISRVGSSGPSLKMGVSALVTGALVAMLVLLGRATARRGWPVRRVNLLHIAALPGVTALVLGIAWASDALVLSRLRQPGSQAVASPATGVLMITMDSVRADHLSTHGYSRDTTPGLRALLSHATLFRRAVAASDMSLGTHGSLFTGVYPGRHGAYEAQSYPAGRPLSAECQTLAERLAAAGYVTFGAAANPYFLNAAYGVTRGFSLFDVHPNDRLEMQSRFRRLAAVLSGESFSVHRRARELNAVILAGVDAARAGGHPFFAFANYMEAHAPYTADPSLREAFPGYDPSAVGLDGAAFLGRGSRPVFGERERRHLISQYDAAIATIDRELTRLFAVLRERGVYDGLLIVITADHGEMLGERGAFGHGTGLSEEVLRVPLIVKLPWQREGRVVESRVSQVDVPVTIFEALGLKVDGDVDGRSLLGPGLDPSRVVMAESPPALALYLGPFKLLSTGNGERQLFDVEADPAGRVDLFHVQEAGTRQARLALEDALGHAARGRRPAVDPAVLERLKSLGYTR